MNIIYMNEQVPNIPNMKDAQKTKLRFKCTVNE